MSFSVVKTSLSSFVSSNTGPQNQCKCLLPPCRSEAQVERAFIVQQGYEGVGWGVKGRGSKTPPSVWPPLLQETSNNINGIFTPPTSCSPSQPFNHTTSRPGHQYYNQITRSLIWLERGPFAKEGFQGLILWSSPQSGKTISTSESHRVSMLNPGWRKKKKILCTALQRRALGLGAQCQWKPEGPCEVPKSWRHKFTRFTRF